MQRWKSVRVWKQGDSGRNEQRQRDRWNDELRGRSPRRAYPRRAVDAGTQLSRRRQGAGAFCGPRLPVPQTPGGGNSLCGTRKAGIGSPKFVEVYQPQSGDRAHDWAHGKRAPLGAKTPHRNVGQCNERAAERRGDELWKGDQVGGVVLGLFSALLKMIFPVPAPSLPHNARVFSIDSSRGALCRPFGISRNGGTCLIKPLSSKRPQGVGWH